MLNLFAGLGGNRLPWEGNITAVENEPEIARIYKCRFPEDTVIEEDAWKYLEEHFHEYDFIWASPPCPTHSKMVRTHVGIRYNGRDMRVELPDLRLYSAIIFLKNLFRGDWIVENVNPYYEELVPETAIVGRHLLWSNLPLVTKLIKTPAIMFKAGEDFNGYLDKLSQEVCVDINLLNNTSKIFSYCHDKGGQLLRNTIHPIVSREIWRQINECKNERQSRLF